ncbi:hypothetical protein ACWEWU_13135 [Staphylococcus xylosus]
MYYKVFIKNQKIHIMKFDNLKTNYSNFIKKYTDEKFNQYIVTTSKMIKIIKYNKDNNGILKNININEDLYNYNEICQIDGIIDKINDKNDIDIEKVFFHDGKESIDIISIKVKYQKKYITINSNGIIAMDQREFDEIVVKELIESSL